MRVPYPSNPSAIVSGAGTAEANGTYTPRGTHVGKPYYNLVGQVDNFLASSIYWDGSVWGITAADETTLYGQDTGDDPFPWQVVQWNTIDGAEPTPTVTSG